MSELEKFQVKILGIGKAATDVQAEDHNDAVLRVVSAFAKRVGESPHMMAFRLDKMADVKGPTGPWVSINVLSCCPPPEEVDKVADKTDLDFVDEIGQAMAEVDNADDTSFSR